MIGIGERPFSAFADIRAGQFIDNLGEYQVPGLPLVTTCTDGSQPEALGPSEVKAAFPDRCIGCGADSPTAKIKGVGHAGGAINLLAPFLSRKIVAWAPACTSCRKARRWSTEFLEAALVQAMVGLMALLYYLVNLVNVLQPLGDIVPKFIGKRVGFIVALILVGPIWFLLHKRIKPLLFEMDISSEGVQYKFRDVNYANDFEKLNQIHDVSDELGDERPGSD